jgi:hypothetical protein
MTPVKMLRVLIVCEVALIVLTIAVDSATRGALPATLQSYLAEADAATPSATIIVAAVVGLITLVAVGVGWIGLWRLWRPARAIYTTALLTGLGAVLFIGPVVWSSAAGALDDLASICAGIILGLIYFSELRAHFERRTA